MKLYMNVTFSDITADELDRIIEWCNKPLNDYDFLTDPIDGSIQVFEIDERDLQEIKTII